MNHKLAYLIGNLNALSTNYIYIYNKRPNVFRHHTWVGHPREAVKIDNDHIVVYSEKNIIASLDTRSGAVGKHYSHHLFCHHFNILFL